MFALRLAPKRALGAVYFEHRRLIRLLPAAYRGWAAVHWTMAIQNRRRGWLNIGFHEAFLKVLDAKCRKYGVAVPVYVLMPDHIHALAVGVTEHSDQFLWLRAVRRRLNELLDPYALQKQAFDHVLRGEERRSSSAFAKVVGYLCENPVVEKLVDKPTDWEFMGCVVPALKNLDPRTPGFSDAWWDYWNSTRR